MQKSDWVFNLRTTGGLEDSDSDEDDDTDDDRINAISHEAQLLKDLDLSSRQENVDYKPNPWNIAKINAVSRTTRPSQVPATNSVKPVAVCRDNERLSLHSTLRKDTPEPQPLPAKPVSISTSFSSPLPDHNRRVRQHTTWNSRSVFHSSPNTSHFKPHSPIAAQRFRSPLFPRHLPPPPHFIKVPARTSSPADDRLPHIDDRPPKRRRYTPPPDLSTPQCPSPPRVRSTQSAKTLRKDAYTFNASDPDAEWSTLPSRKKKETRESGKFRLPIKIPGRGRGESGKAEEAGTKRRVIIYLPPARATAVSQAVVEEPVVNAGSNEPQHQDRVILPETSGDGPRSSPTLVPSSSPNSTLDVDLDAITKKYADTRAMMSKVTYSACSIT